MSEFKKCAEYGTEVYEKRLKKYQEERYKDAQSKRT